MAEPTYLGLMMETFLDQYQVDVYGYITITNYKYILIKNEQRTSILGQKPSDIPVKSYFKSLIKVYTEMLLNPFFDYDRKLEDEEEEDMEEEQEGG
mmetsp:Transcript_407/g.446  ORF Transcript_407/g.446 Transcript_407/m.446 type:complete len:96 (-) Transcript_407:110-397(-)|eukprot:CAMPEP_0170560356 /NCGR_PEP_ID=MMETSP0211-20121228/48464_1 /TAXON_ID=311385 /ORGANISM="Pseudokeronopsis sp., Strain OXSARD2" /LENGTH=95 /DNA_ID=CAMNT_0010874447 /DNA_START=164 /DNA_END=451 /DNA_ORIENTATION=+